MTQNKLPITPTKYQQEVIDKMLKGESVQGSWCRQAGATTALAIAAVLYSQMEQAKIVWHLPAPMHSYIFEEYLYLFSNLLGVYVDHECETEYIYHPEYTDCNGYHHKAHTSVSIHSHTLKLKGNTIQLSTSKRTDGDIYIIDLPTYYTRFNYPKTKIIWAIGNFRPSWEGECSIVRWYDSQLINEEVVKSIKKRIPDEIYNEEYECKFNDQKN
jgi:hypothetical protein